ncbi:MULTISPECIES: segregation/condensation protein A [Bacillaceae]|uniref:segregation/condensation protein A n=1 Tax=Bacillaceae TaxID=186817 RepID=UPI001E5942F0|nr:MULTISPECIES: segregation/condensation protein A [Bacillaceae]MCE4047166.1 segregation/condensation protein A [Bacillus sp. Au-Bac7]MCM3031312.1 segregation/condensation protein A [Niallia sp. MER 6]MDL0435703.1 segregation/condensation protein A [Niallia sp. SS-2023]UPO86464.1 segregation/condensation protein A [Niallia sp. Man26]
MQYNVKIDSFEGPLDLLLHLINKLEIDIYDINVAEITEQYLEYIHAMSELQLDIASEFLVMAATLLAIKSKMLLPKYDEELLDDDLMYEPEEDSREDLIERLVEYRKFKEAADDLKEMEQERGLIFTKPPSDLSDFTQDADQNAKSDLDVSLYDMLAAFQKLMRRKKLQAPLSTKITRQEIPIESRMEEILVFIKSRRRTHFEELFPVHDKTHIVVTFLALLELMKRQALFVEQEHNFADIFVVGKEEERF